MPRPKKITTEPVGETVQSSQSSTAFGAAIEPVSGAVQPEPESTTQTTSVTPEMSEPVAPKKSSNDARDTKISELEAKIDVLSALVNKKKETKIERLHTANVMFVEDKPVVEFGQVREVNQALIVKLTTMDLDGNLEEIPMDYLSAVSNNRRYPCEILKLDKEPFTTHQGSIPMPYTTRVADQENRRTSTGDGFVARTITLEQTKVKSKALIRFMEGPWEGKKIEVDVDLCLNK